MSENTAINNLIQLAQSRKPVFHDPDDEQTVRVDRFAERYALPPLANVRVVRQIEVHEAPAPIIDPTPVVARKSPTPSVYEAPAMSAPVAVQAPMPYAMPPQPPAAPPLSTELRRAMRKLAAPIAFVALFAVSLSSYLAFAGSGSVQTPAAAAQAISSPAPVVQAPATPPPPPAKPTPAVEPIPAADEPAHASVNSIGELPAAAAEETDDIEMAPEVVAQPAKTERHHRERREAKAEKPEKVEPKVEKAKPAKDVADAEIPANTANKTSMESGKIVVTSNVAAMIYLDGRATKLTTPSQFSVPAGHHKITLLEPGTGKAKTQDFEVAAGKVASVAKQF